MKDFIVVHEAFGQPGFLPILVRISEIRGASWFYKCHNPFGRLAVRDDYLDITETPDQVAQLIEEASK